MGKIRSCGCFLTMLACIGLLTACGAPDVIVTDPSNSQLTVEPAQPTTVVGEPAVESMDRAKLAIPDEYTQVKMFEGSYSFGDVEVVYATNDDMTSFYIQYPCFDEEQILMGTISDGICTVTYDKIAFVSGNAQVLYRDAMNSENPWHPLTGVGPGIPDEAKE